MSLKESLLADSTNRSDKRPVSSGTLPEAIAISDQDLSSGTSNISFDAAKSISQVNTSAGMAAFVAGFTYYELTRFNFNGFPGTSSANYVNSMVGAFTFSVLSVSIASFINRYNSTLSLPQAQSAFAIGSNDWARAVHRLFMLSFLCLGCALIFVGDTYYPTTCGSMKSSCLKLPTNVSCTTENLINAKCDLTLTRYIPMVGGVISLLGMIYGIVKTVSLFLEVDGIALSGTEKITASSIFTLTKGKAAHVDSEQERKEVTAAYTHIDRSPHT
jgi:hypothetical protein